MLFDFCFLQTYYGYKHLVNHLYPSFSTQKTPHVPRHRSGYPLAHGHLVQSQATNFPKSGWPMGQSRRNQPRPLHSLQAGFPVEPGNHCEPSGRFSFHSGIYILIRSRFDSRITRRFSDSLLGMIGIQFLYFYPGFFFSLLLNIVHADLFQ